MTVLPRSETSETGWASRQVRDLSRTGWQSLCIDLGDVSTSYSSDVLGPAGTLARKAPLQFKINVLRLDHVERFFALRAHLRTRAPAVQAIEGFSHWQIVLIEARNPGFLGEANLPCRSLPM